MKTVYHTKDVWMNRYSVKIEPRHGTPYCRVWNRDNAHPENDAGWIAEVGSELLAGTHIPVEFHSETIEAIARLIKDMYLVDANIYDEREGWGVRLTLCPELENIYMKGVGATPAEAIRNAEELPWFWSRWVKD